MVYVRSPVFGFSHYDTAAEIEGMRRRNSGAIRPLLGQEKTFLRLHGVSTARDQPWVLPVSIKLVQSE